MLFQQKLIEDSSEEVFCGYIEGTPRIEGSDPHHSRTHRQQYRIYSGGGISPALCSGLMTILVAYEE